MPDRTLRGDLGLPPLTDLIAPGLQVIFIGFNPGERSAQMGHYYGYPGNRFWWLLWQAGLTDRRLAPEEDARLLEYGCGLTDLVERPSKSSGDLSGWELREGREQLLAKLHRCQPRIACCNGKGVYAALSGQKEVAYGRQPASVLPGIIDFVAASPSGRSRETLQTKLALYRELKALVTP